MVTTTVESLIHAVRQYAYDHYDHDGWDFVVETWEDVDILKWMGPCKTPAQAIKNVRSVCKLLDEQRRAVIKEIY